MFNRYLVSSPQGADLLYRTRELELFFCNAMVVNRALQGATTKSQDLSDAIAMLEAQTCFAEFNPLRRRASQILARYHHAMKNPPFLKEAEERPLSGEASPPSQGPAPHQPNSPAPGPTIQPEKSLS